MQTVLTPQGKEWAEHGARGSQVFYPWRRFFARSFDLTVYSILWQAFLAFGLHVNVTARAGLSNIMDSYVALLIMLFIEPFLLHTSGATPGKIIFGLRIVSHRGERLSYGEGLERTWGVFGKGQGYGIPIYNLVRAWKSYKICSENEVQPWDECLSYTIKDTKAFRSVAFIAAEIAAFAVVLTIVFSQLIPPNRGELTIAQFVENYNYYAKYYEIEFGNEYLDENGEWTEKADDGTFWADAGLDFENKPKFNFITDNGYVQGISFDAEEKNADLILLSPYENHMILTALALAGAQDDMWIFSKIPADIVNQISDQSAQDGSFTEAGLIISWETESDGFPDFQNGFLFSEEGTPENSFTLHFSVTRQEMTTMPTGKQT